MKARTRPALPRTMPLVLIAKDGVLASAPAVSTGAAQQRTARPRTPVSFLRVTVSPMTREQVVEWISTPSTGHRLIVGHNLHSAYMSLTHPHFAAVYARADVVLVDGQPVRWLGRREARRRGGPSAPWGRDHRVGSVDWLALADRLHGVRRIAAVGASEESNRAFVEHLTGATGVDVRGWAGEDWSVERSREVRAGLRAFAPDLVIIGLGMPLQERFLEDWEAQLPPACYALVGAAIDQVSGTQRRAPGWAGAIGLEWAWRLALEPRRLAGRYLVEPFRLLALLRRTP